MKLLGAKTVSDLNPRLVSAFLYHGSIIDDAIDLKLKRGSTKHQRTMLTLVSSPSQQVNTRALERDIFDGGSGLGEMLVPVKAKI